MPLLQTDALVLHVADYLESSRLLRLLTREAGVQSVVARGARSSRKRFGSAVDLFAEGQAQIQLKQGRDLHALTAFDVTRSRAALASDLARFTAAAALGEIVLRLVHEEAAPLVFDLVVGGLDRLAKAAPGDVVGEGVGITWRILAEVGFRPAVDRCAECHAPIPIELPARFHVVTGGALCERCARLLPGGRLLPPDAREALRAWLTEGPTGTVQMDEAAARAHQRLLREFLTHHLPDSRPLKAWAVWEQGNWTTS
jgi:DNA repair protein RecO (recombination protein O)